MIPRGSAGLKKVSVVSGSNCNCNCFHVMIMLYIVIYACLNCWFFCAKITFTLDVLALIPRRSYLDTNEKKLYFKVNFGASLFLFYASLTS